MISMGRTYLVIAMFTVAACLVATTGCGNGKRVAQVRGKVVFKNGSMPKAGIRMVRLEPALDTSATIRKGASGSINEDGTFDIYTLRPGDGVYLGQYAVTFTFLKSFTEQKQMIANKYTKAATTPYHLNLERNTDDLEYELESAGAIAN
jgi:hypothetical protein